MVAVTPIRGRAEAEHVVREAAAFYRERFVRRRDEVQSP